MSNNVKIGVQATLDDATIAASAAALGEKLNRVAQTVAQANKVRFNPVDKATVEDLKKIEAKFIELTRISGGLRQRMKATGQDSSSFADLDWARLYEDPAIRLRKMQQAFRHTTVGTAFAGAIPAGGGGNGGNGGGGGGGRSGGAAFDAASKVAGAGMRAIGPVGGSIAGAIGHGIQNGVGAGIGFGAVDLLSKAVGGAISAVKEKVDAASQEGIGYDTLKRTLGDVNVSFEGLRKALRNASYDVSMTFEETQKLGSDFAKISGTAKMLPKDLADEVSNGGGFGRSFGMDPSQSNQFFAQMRQFGVTSNTQDSRRLALMIGEAVTRSGSTAKTDEMLQVIASYTASQARNGMATPNVAGYSGMLSGLVGSGIPGLDPQGAAALLSRVNSSIASGGGRGEASQNYFYRVLGQRNGLDPVQSMILQQQGAFGTAAGTFGPGSLAERYFGHSFKGLSRDTNLSAILGGIRSMSNGNKSLELSQTTGAVGVNESQAMALLMTGPKQLDGMVSRLARLGLNYKSMNGTGISALAQIEGGLDLGAQANALLGNKKNPLTVDQGARLRAAMGGGDQEKLKDILTELTYTRGQEQTEGSKTRDSIQGVDKRLQELATGLIVPTNDIRNAMVYMTGGGKKTASQINKEMDDINRSEKIDGIKAKYASAIGEQRSIMDDNGLLAQERKKAESRFRASRMISSADMDAERKRLSGEIAAMQGREAAARSKISQLGSGMESEVGAVNSAQAATPQSMTGDKKAFAQKYGAAAERAGKALGVNKALILAQWGLETRWGKSIVPGTNNLGNIKDFNGGGVGVVDNATGSYDRYRQFSSTDDYADSYVDLIKRKYPGAMNAGSNGAAFTGGLKGYAEDPNYGSKIIGASSGLFSTPMPDGAPSSAAAGAGGATGKAEVTITLQYPNGQKAAPPTTVTTKVGAPRAQGQ